MGDYNVGPERTLGGADGGLDVVARRNSSNGAVCYTLGSHTKACKLRPKGTGPAP